MSASKSFGPMPMARLLSNNRLDSLIPADAMTFCHHVNYVKDTNGDIACVSRSESLLLPLDAPPAINSTKPGCSFNTRYHQEIRASTVKVVDSQVCGRPDKQD